MKKLILLTACLTLTGCSTFGLQKNHLDYEDSPCACAGDPVIFNGKSYDPVTGELISKDA